MTQVVRNLEETSSEILSEILLRVWGSTTYDENHLDPTDLSTHIRANVDFLLGALLHPDRDGEDLDGWRATLDRADEIGRTRAIQGVDVAAVIRSWRTAEQVIEERLIARAGEVDTGALLNAIRRLGALIGTLTDRSVDRYRRAQLEVTEHYDRLSTDLVAQIVAGAGLSAAEISERARSIQADPEEQFTAVVLAARADATTASQLTAQRHLLGHLGLRLRGRILIGTVDGRPLLLVPTSRGGVDVEPLVRRAVETGDGLLVGMSSRPTELAEAYASAHQASLAAEVGERLGRADGVVPFGTVVAETLLLERPEAADLLLAPLRPLLGRPDLLQTLRAYLRCGLSARAAARELFVHPNTVPHRLATIRHLLGRDLVDVTSMTDLVLALRLLDLQAVPRSEP